MDTRTIFFVGKPGCGKGTQAKLLAEKTGWRIIAAGEQFRAIADEDTPVGRKVKTIVDAGVLIPHWFAEYLYLKALFSVREDEGVIFDGFSRRVPEAEAIIDSLAWLSRPFTVLNIQITDETAQKRLALRKDVEGRADDAVVGERLKEYHENTEPSIEVFRKAARLIDIDGEPSPEEIFADIKLKIGLK